MVNWRMKTLERNLEGKNHWSGSFKNRKIKF